MNITTGTCPPTKAHAAFTLIDLVVVTAVLAVLVGLLLPALATTQSTARGIFCVSNKKQLILAFTTYATDNLGRFPGNFPSGSQNPELMTSAERAKSPWVVGNMDWTLSSQNTNTAYLTESRYSSLSVYLKRNATVFKCPADRYLSLAQLSKGWPQRVRSVSANMGVGEDQSSPSVTHVTKFSEMVRPAPSGVWVYLDEHPDSIDNPIFDGPYADRWYDLPASYHDGGAAFAFADGSALIHLWKASARGVPVTTQTLREVFPRSRDVDVYWMLNFSPHR